MSFSLDRLNPRAPSYALALVAAILLLLRLSLPFGVFWISDAGNKFIQVQNFAYGHYQHVAIAYPASDLDPRARWFPAGGEHFRPIGRDFFSIAAFQFPLISAPLFQMAGAPAVALLPLLFGLATLALLPPLLRALRVRGGEESSKEGSGSLEATLAVLLAAFATPLAFYSLDFWEHTATTFFATLAVVLLLRREPRGRRCFAAGVAIGAAIFFREEGYLFLAALLLSISTLRLRRSAIASLLGGVAVIVVPLWIAQREIFGHFLGLHLLAHAAPESLSLRLARVARNLFYFLAQLHSNAFVATLLALPLVALFVVGASRAAQPRRRLLALAAFAAAAVVAMVLLIANHDPISNTISTQGLLLFVPISAFLLLWWRRLVARDHPYAFVTRIVLFYSILTPLLLRANWSGVIWGPRYFLTILPSLVVVAIAGWNESRATEGRAAWAPALATLLVLSSVALEAHGLRLLQQKLVATAALRDLLKTAPPVVMTDVFWLPEEMGSLFFEKKIMMPPNDAELAGALNALHAHGVTEFLFVTSPRYHWFGGGAVRALDHLSTRRLSFRSATVPLLDVNLLYCSFRRLPNSAVARPRP